MQCTKSCENCTRPHKISHRYWCYDEKYHLEALIEGKEIYKIGRTKIRVLPMIDNENTPEEIDLPFISGKNPYLKPNKL